MGSTTGPRNQQWTVYNGVKPRVFPPPNPESLMLEIDTAIKKLEYARATSHLLRGSSTPPTPGTPDPNTNNNSDNNNKNKNVWEKSRYDARKADEAYRAGCGALAVWKLDEALHYLNISLSNCPPDNTSAVAKLQSLISLTSHHLQRSPSPTSPL